MKIIMIQKNNISLELDRNVRRMESKASCGNKSGRRSRGERRINWEDTVERIGSKRGKTLVEMKIMIRGLSLRADTLEKLDRAR